MWKSFKGIRKLNTINSDAELGADIAHNIRLSKEKSGQLRSIRSSGWFGNYGACGTTTIAQTVGSGLTNITVEHLTFANTALVHGSGTTVFTFDGDVWVDSDNNEVNLYEYGIKFDGTPVANDELTVTYNYEDVIRLFSANFSGYSSDQLVAFTKTSTAINAWIILDETFNGVQTKIATFPLAPDVTDACMVQFGDRLVMAVAFGSSNLSFVCYSGTPILGWIAMGSTGFYYRTDPIKETTTNEDITDITHIKPYRSRLAINGVTTYNSNDVETINGVWFSEAGNPVNFNADYITSATETSAFFVETGEYVNSLEEYHGLTAFCRNRSYNITGTNQNDISVETLTAKGIFGNATFTLNGRCFYVDSFGHNMFALRDNIDGTIGLDEPIGDDIQDYLDDVKDVTINVIGRRVRMVKSSGQALVYDVDIGEWTEEQFLTNSRVETFLNQEFICNGTDFIFKVNDTWGTNSFQVADGDNYYSHYRTNLIWLDSQSSVKSHLYPFAIILEPQTSNDFYIKFTTDRGESFQSRITRAGFSTVATYSNSDSVPEDGSQFVEDDEDLSGRVFFALTQTDLLVTAERPPFWRYLQIDIYTLSPEQQFNISGIEAKNTVVSNEMLDY